MRGPLVEDSPALPRSSMRW